MSLLICLAAKHCMKAIDTLLILPKDSNLKSSPLFQSTHNALSQACDLSKLIALILLTSFSLPVHAQAVRGDLTSTIYEDQDGDGDVDRGDIIQHEVEIENDSGGDLQDLLFNQELGDHQTLVPGTFNISPLAYDDSFTTGGDVVINIEDLSRSRK